VVSTWSTLLARPSVAIDLQMVHTSHDCQRFQAVTNTCGNWQL